jgi:hypothetical protein
MLKYKICRAAVSKKLLLNGRRAAGTCAEGADRDDADASAHGNCTECSVLVFPRRNSRHIGERDANLRLLADYSLSINGAVAPFSICNDGKNDLAGSKRRCGQENIKQKKSPIFFRCLVLLQGINLFMEGPLVGPISPQRSV